MTKETEDYLTFNKLGTTSGIRELKQFLKLDVGVPVKKINVMDIDQIVKAVIEYHQENPIKGS